MSVTHPKTVHGAEHVVFGGHFAPSQAPSGGPVAISLCVRACVCVHRGMGAMFERILCPTCDPLRRVSPTRSPVIIHTPTTTSPKSPATTSETLSSSTSALPITSRRYELRELALLLGCAVNLFIKLSYTVTDFVSFSLVPGILWENERICFW